MSVSIGITMMFYDLFTASLIWLFKLFLTRFKAQILGHLCPFPFNLPSRSLIQSISEFSICKIVEMANIFKKKKYCFTLNITLNNLLCWSGLPSLFVVPVATFTQSSNRHCQAEAFLGTEVNKLQSSQQLISAKHKEPRTTQWFVRRESK